MLGILAMTLVINGAYMLISPRAWLRHSSWFPSAPSFRERYADGRGLAELRYAGAGLLFFIGWVIYKSLFARV
jgi:uncharacterized protein YjeT (DUF2065 family)